MLPSGRSICIILFSLLHRIVLTESYGELNCFGLHILITFIYIITPLLRGRSQLSTFMKAYTALGGRGLGPPYAFFPENQHLILITDNVL